MNNLNNLNFFALRNRATGNYYGFPKIISVSTQPMDEYDTDTDTDSVYDLHTKCWVNGFLDCKQFETKESAEFFLAYKKNQFAKFEKHFDTACIPFGCSNLPEYDLLNCDIVNFTESIVNA